MPVHRKIVLLQSNAINLYRWQM